MNEEVRHFSLRKLSVGLASVLVGVSIFGASQTVKADTVANSQASSLTNNTQSSDTQKNENATKSTFSDNEQGNSVKNNATQTQDETKNDQIKNVQQPPTNSKEVNDISDLDTEKNAVRTGSLPKADNQSNNQPEGNFQAQPQNSPKLAKKVLTTNLIATPPTTNGGFDEATWGKLDVNNWQGSAQDGVYQLTSYTGDPSHIIVPNEADFEQAGKSTNGLQVGIDSYTLNSLFSRDGQNNTIAFSKTNNQAVKAIGTNWSDAFLGATLSKFDGSSLDVSTVTDMSGMFENSQISDLTSLANWDTSNVTDMNAMFTGNKVSDLTPLANWDTSNVTGMSSMFRRNKVSDLTPLANWNTSQVTSMRDMFESNQISDLTPLANWKTGNVTDMSRMFTYNRNISDLTPLAHWDTSKVTDMSGMFSINKISDLAPLANWDTSKVTDMSGMLASNSISNLTPLANWDTSQVTSMSDMFESNQISNLTPLANWKTGNVTDMSRMFTYNRNISDLTPLAHWDTSKVTDMSGMFSINKISDLAPLANWDTSKVTDMSGMLASNSISNLTPLANWDISKVTNVSYMLANNPDLIDLKPIANWNMSSVSFGEFGGPFSGDTKLDLTNINNTKLMQGFLKTPKALKGSTFITNNADFVKAVVGQDLPTLTNIAKRTIVFNIPHAAPETIVQIINYKALAPVQIGWSSSIGGGGFSSGTGSSVVVGGHGSSSSGSSSGGGFRYTLGGGGFSSGAGSSVVVGGRGSSSGSGSSSGGGGNRNIISHRMRMVFASVGEPFQTSSDGPKIIKTYSAKDLKASDWQLDDSKPNDAVIVNGQIRFKSVKIPHVNGYKARIVKNPINPMKLMVSFIAIPTENKPLLPDKEKPSKPIEETPSKQSVPVNNANKSADDLQKRVVTELNSNDSGWTMPTENTQPETYTVEMPADNTIDLSDLVIAEPVHAQTRTQIRVTKRFKLRKHGKKHVVKHFKHRKKTVRQFKKYRL